MESNVELRKSGTGGLVLGGLLILLGAFFLFGQFVGQIFHIDLGQYVWPFFIIVPGIVLLVLSIAVDKKAGEALGILGGMVSMTGLLLFTMNVTGLWASWAYAWALAVPTGAGLGLALYGLLRSEPDARRRGLQLAGTGLGIFVVAGLFFELVIGINGFGLGRYGWPLLLIGLGCIVLVRNLLPARRQG